MKENELPRPRLPVLVSVTDVVSPLKTAARLAALMPGPKVGQAVHEPG